MKLKTEQTPDSGYETLSEAGADKPFQKNDERRMRLQGFGSNTGGGFLVRNNVRDRGANAVGGNDLAPVMDDEGE